MCKRVSFYIVMLLSFISVSLFVSINRVKAEYRFCDERIEGTEYYDCGSFIYTYPENMTYSSKIISRNKNNSIIYVGEQDGVSLFYANGFKFYNFIK